MSQATLFQIKARFRAREFAPTLLSDFSTDAGTPVDADIIVADPRWSLYSLDLDQGCAVFVRLAEGCDLSKAPFIMTAQFQAAQEVLTLSVDDLIVLSKSLPEPDNLIFLFSIGRCGTTLANAMLNRVAGTFSLSEPRAFLPIVFNRLKMAEARAKALIGAVTKLMLRPPKGTVAQTLAIKFHSQVLFQADLFHNAFPQARFVFLYRDAHAWVNSKSRFLQNLGVPLVLDDKALSNIWKTGTADEPPATLEPYLYPESAPFAHAPVLAAEWAFCMGTYLRLKAAGVPFLAFHYDDLNAEPEITTRALFAHAGLPAQAVDMALEAFAKDSQEGTAIARGGSSQGLCAQDYAVIDATLARHKPPIAFDLRL